MPIERSSRLKAIVAGAIWFAGFFPGCADCTGDRVPDDADIAVTDSSSADRSDPSNSAPDGEDEGSDTKEGDVPPTDTTSESDSSDGTPTDTAADGSLDGGSIDASDTGQRRDSAPGDTSSPDLDVASDTGNSSLDTASDTDSDTSPSGLSVPCSNGSGWTVFKFHWSQNSGSSPSIDVWDASCSYSLAPGSTCKVTLVNNPSFNSRTPKAVLLTGSEVLRVRYDVSTLQFTDASVHVQARSYSTTNSTRFEVWSPIYGAKTSPDRVDNDFVYDWYRVPWSNYLSPSDDPDLTAIELSDLGGDELAVHAVELCVE